MLFSSKSPALRHWLKQRLSAILLLPLSIWFILTLPTLLPLPHAGLVAWLQHGWLNITLLILFITVAFKHGKLGIEVVLEDYVHGKAHHRAMRVLNIVALLAPLAVIAALLWLRITG